MSSEPDPSSRIQLKKWQVVCSWNYLNTTDACSICRNAMTGKCLECSRQPTEDECVPVWGRCSHTYHLHCINRWLSRRNTCPLCDSEWDFDTSYSTH